MPQNTKSKYQSFRASVAQWIRASVFGTEGRTFESCRRYHCPRGWQLPTYDTTDPKSYNNLIVRTYGGNYRSWSDRLDGSLADSILLKEPLSFLRSGRYNWQSAARYGRGSLGYYWESRVSSVADAIGLGFSSSYLHPQYGYLRGYGFSVRCVSR